MFTHDLDIKAYLTSRFPPQSSKAENENDFYAEYHEALEAYFDGEWEFAIEALDK